MTSITDTPEPTVVGWVTTWTEKGVVFHHLSEEDPRKNKFGMEFMQSSIACGEITVEEEYIHQVMTVTEHKAIIEQLLRELDK